MKLYKIMFFITLTMGTFITISSYSWFGMWIGLEINLLSIIPLLKSSNNIYPSESALKYFITQALASGILLFSIIMSAMMKEFINQEMLKPMFNLITSSSLLTKMGAAPFHFWFPEVIDGLNWMNSAIMFTWQKIAPFIILIMISSSIPLMFLSTIIIFSSLIAGIAGINQTSIRKILAYSSINHIAWMLASMLISSPTWLMYFTIYSIISLSLIMILSMLSAFMMNQLIFLINMYKKKKLFLMINMFSLGGLPPFLGFLPKWTVISGMIMINSIVLAMILIITTLIMLYIYSRVIFSSISIKMIENLPIHVQNPSIPLSISGLSSITGLMFIPLMYSFI